MTRLSDEFVVDLAMDEASLACRDAIASVGWNIKSVEPQRIVPKVGVGLSRNPSKIEVLLAQTGESGTTVTLSGSIVGIGPLQKSHLNGEMNRLRNAIEVAVAKQIRGSAPAAAPAEPVRDPVEQIRRLAELRDSGAITAVEFESKKQELLGQI